VTGGVAAVMIGLLFGNNFIEHPSKALNPVRWVHALLYIPLFLWEMTKANFDVAYRVIVSLFRPRNMPISPGIVRVKTRIQSEMGRTFLANSITLTPGTFTIDIKDDILYIHCINVPATELEEATEKIVKRFEKLLLRIFD
jgi:multicomponent Na+:H+ antiporter subunit E